MEQKKMITTRTGLSLAQEVAETNLEEEEAKEPEPGRKVPGHPEGRRGAEVAG